jgi:hypothetical protein
MASVDETVAGAMENVLSLAIIGTREPDDFQYDTAEDLARYVSTEFGMRVRTGAANGIDHQAMKGTMAGKLDCCLPWFSYNRSIIPAHANCIVYDPWHDRAWSESVDKHHPNPDKLTRGARALHARNYGIIAPAYAALAFPGRGESGGTGQGIRIARDLGIPIYVRSRGEMQGRETDVILTWLSALVAERKAAA